MKLIKTISITIGVIILSLLVVQIASALTISEVSSSPSTVQPGKAVTLHIGLDNDEDEKIEDVSVSLDLSTVPFSPETSSEAHIDEIRDGRSDSVELGLIADPDAEALSYKIPITISYSIDNSTKTKKAFVAIVVNAKPEITLSSESYLISGQRDKVQVQITNKGLARAKFLEISVGIGAYDLLSSDSVYIGDLDSNDFDSASFEMFPKSVGVISVPVSLTYKDSANNDYTETSTVQIRVYSREEALELGLITQSKVGLYIFVVILLIVLWVVYSRLRKWMKKRKANNSGGK